MLLFLSQNVTNPRHWEEGGFLESSIGALRTYFNLEAVGRKLAEAAL